MHMKGICDMGKRIIHLALVAMVLAGCQSRGKEPSNDGLPSVVGGIPIKYLVGEKKGIPVLEVRFDEIILSNGQVTVTGTFLGFPNQRLTLDPFGLSGALACTILSSTEIERPFRLVSDAEFVVMGVPRLDWNFKSSTLFAGGDRPVRFSHSYKGFPSDAEVMEDKPKMNIISRFRESNDVSYFMRRITDVRFADRSYEYPNEELSWVNIKGEGKCTMRVYKNDL